MKAKLLLAAIGLMIATTSLAQEQDDGLKSEVNELTDDQKIELIMSSGEPVELYNFTTQSVDLVQRVDKLTPSEFEAYIPPIPEIKEFFNFYIEEGMHPYDAYMETMTQLQEAIQES